MASDRHVNYALLSDLVVCEMGFLTKAFVRARFQAHQGTAKSSGRYWTPNPPKKASHNDVSVLAEPRGTNHEGTSASGRYCCKSRKSLGDNFPAKGRRDRRPSISVLSIALRRSPVSLPSGDEVPHIFTRKARLRPREFLISSAKRLLQQNLPKGDIRIAADFLIR